MSNENKRKDMMTSFRVSLLESSIICALLSVGYQGAILFGRKWSPILRPQWQNKSRNVDFNVFDMFEPPLLADRMMRKEQLLQSLLSTPPSLVEDGPSQDSRKAILAEAFLHPALLAHPHPRHIVILTNSTYENRSHSYTNQVVRHKSVEKVRILPIEQLQQSWERNLSIYIDDGQPRNFRIPPQNRTSKQGVPWILQDNSKDGSEIPISILFIDSTVDLSPAELAVHIHRQPTFLPFSDHFTMIVEIEDRSVIPEWVKALSNWETVSDVTIRLPLPPPRRKQLRHYLVAFQDAESEAFFHRNEAEWNRKLLDKLHQDEGETQDESFVLDSTLLSKFEYPSKHSEVEFCQTHVSHKLCQSGGSGFDPFKPHVPVDLLDVQRSLQGEHSGRGVFATVDIAPKSYIGIDTPLIRLPWTSTQLMLEFTERDNDIHSWAHDDLEAYFDGYGFVREPWGMIQYDVDATKLTFVNHGCNGSNNVGSISRNHETNLQLPNLDDEDQSSLWTKIPREYLASLRDNELYFPIRNPGDVVSTESNKFIAAGQELLDNYLTFAGTVDSVEFWKNVKSLRQECSGVAGFIEAWETKYREDKRPVQQNLTESLPGGPLCEQESYQCSRVVFD